MHLKIDLRVYSDSKLLTSKYFPQANMTTYFRPIICCLMCQTYLTIDLRFILTVKMLTNTHFPQANMARYFRLIICCLWSTSSTNPDNSTSKTDLYIGGFFGVNITDGGWSTAGVIPALEMALDHVNNDSNILGDYQLKYVWRDSKVIN